MHEDKYSNILKIIKISEKCEDDTYPCKHLVTFITISGEEQNSYWSGADIVKFYESRGVPPWGHFEAYRSFTLSFDD